ncbi:sigma-E processing peptidase SpoIIGA [Lacrimispora algidixylanolytica]|uniref:sigma-E processing peptidase SpoIIGA n=1 Tax=Lacrimispora algidixylanolytica TaxID=94868 RepID=UPI000E751E50|nr:sigma-E processing peptidase SpoIIGA [Lacrimispora algidixylanolytica]
MVLTNSERYTGYNVRTGQEVNAATEINLYIDVLFFINFTMDLLVLSIVRRGLKYRLIWWRMILGAVLGAAWAVLVAAFSLLPLWLEMVITYLVVSTLMVMIAFCIKKPKEIAKAVISEIMEMNISTVKSRLYRALKKLKVILEPELV